MTAPYVKCRACGQDVPEISKATAPEYQYHQDHRPWNRQAQEREEKRQAFFERKAAERNAAAPRMLAFIQAGYCDDTEAAAILKEVKG